LGDPHTARLSSRQTQRFRVASPPANVPATSKRRKGRHQVDSSLPASIKVCKPPAGSWEDEVESFNPCHDEDCGSLVVYLTWKNGQKTQHETKVIYQCCPQKVRPSASPGEATPFPAVMLTGTL
ncbi:uncharacterized protein B0I36DRAFT_252854, partial [Microdochium trichocladiopsis]